MCYSAESSLNAFIIGSASSLFLLNSKNNIDKHIGFFFITVNLMQLLEYFIWKDQKCGKINQFASRLITVVLSFQVFSIMFGGYLFNTFNLDKQTLLILSMLIFIYMIYVIIYNFNNNLTWCTKKNKEGHLVWPNIDYNNFSTIITTYIFYIILGLVFPFLAKDKIKPIFVVLSGLLILIYSKLSIITKTSYESKWCYFSAFVPLFLIIFNFLQIFLKLKNKKLFLVNFYFYYSKINQYLL